MAENKIKTGIRIEVQTNGTEQINQLNKSIENIPVSLKQAEAASQKLKKIDDSLQQIKPSLNTVLNGFKDLASSNDALALVAKEAMKFETAMAQVKKVADGTPEQYEQLSGSLKDLGGQLGIMPDQLAQIAAQGGQMGIAMDRLPEFTEMAAQMSVAFGITAEQAGEMAAKTANVFKLNQDGMQQLGDAINTLGNTTAAKEKEISDVLMRIGGTANQFGLAAEEAAALGAAFISLGKSPEVAGTAINALLSKLQNAKLGTAEFQAGLREVGFSAEEMAANIAQNPQKALTEFLQRLEKLDNQARSETLGKLFGAEYSDDIAVLVGSLKTYDDALATATDREKTFGAMKKETEAALNTTAKQLDQAKAQIVSAAIDLGNTLLPVIQAVIGTVGGVAKGLHELSQEFPMLAQLAGLFLTVKTATVGFQAAVRLLGVESAGSFLKADVGVKNLKKSILETASSAQILGANIKNAVSGNVDKIELKTQSIKNLGASFVQAAQNAAMMFTAFETGNSMGTWLRENVSGIRNLGDEMIRPLAMLHSLWNTGSLEQYNREFRTTSELTKELEQNQKAATKAAQERAEKEKQIQTEKQEKLKQLNQEYANNQKQFDAISGSLKLMAERGQQGSQAYQNLSQKQAQLAGEIMKNQLQLEQFGDNSADGTAKVQAALSGLGVTAAQLSGQLSENAQKILADFGTAAQSVGNDADKMAILFQAAAQKLDSPEALSALKQNMMETATKAGLTVEEINKISAAVPQMGLGLGAVEKAANALGVSLESALVAGTGSAMSAALANFETLKNQLDNLQQNGINTGIVLRESLGKLTETAQSESDIQVLKQEIVNLGATGKLSLQDVERAILAADQKLNQMRQNTDPTAQAFERLGIQTKEALRLSAEQMRQDFELIEQSGEAVSGSLKEKFAQIAQDLWASGDTQQQAWVQSKAAAYDYALTVDNTGKMALKSAAETVQAASEQIQAHQQVTQAATQAAQAQSVAATQTATDTEKITQAASAGAHKLSELGQKVHYTLKQTGAYASFGTANWLNTIRSVQSMYVNVHQTVSRLNDEMESGGNVAQWLAKAEALAISNAKKLDKTTLSNLHSAIDKARQKMAQMADDAASTKKALEKQLLNAQGNTSAVAEMEQREALEKLQVQLNAAQKQGNQKAVADLQQSIELQKRIYQAELDKARAEAEEAKREADEAAAAEAKAKREAEQAQYQQNQEKSSQNQSFRLPETSSFDLGSVDLSLVQIDTSEIANALAQRDSENLAKIKSQLPDLINDLIPKIVQEMIYQINQSAKRGI